jgi:hypothetical protein
MTMRTLLFVVGAAFALPGLAAAQGAYDPPPGTQPYGYGATPTTEQPADRSDDPAQVMDAYDTDDDYVETETDVYDDNAAAQSYDDGYDPQATTQFEGELAPYGSWIDMPTYGRVWSPSVNLVGADFYPYATGGHWVETEYGWTWVSDWSWGWAPFHYGRWLDVAGFGWCWVPGSIWGPAWVTWRSGGGYAGWAPLPPRGITVGPPGSPRTPWRFVVAGQLGASHPAFVPTSVIPTIFPHTSALAAARMVTVNGKSVRINPGPMFRSPFGRTSLAAVAPHALPRASIQPRPGLALAARPWVRAGITSPSRAMPPGRAPSLAPRSVGGALPVTRPVPYAPRPAAPRPIVAPRPQSMYVAPRPYAAPRPYFAPSPSPMFVRTAAPRYTPQPYFTPRTVAATPMVSRPYVAPSVAAPSFNHSFAPSMPRPSFTTQVSAAHGFGRR